MTAEITPDIAAKVANLSRLKLTDEELAKFTDQLSAILEHAADIEALDLEGVLPTSHPYPLKNVFRQDVVSQGATSDGNDTEKNSGEKIAAFKSSVLGVAPESEDGQFKVPPILS